MLPASMINFVTVRFSLNGGHSVGLSSFIVICYKVNKESCGMNAKSGRRDTGNNWLTVGRLRRGWDSPYWRKTRSTKIEEGKEGNSGGDATCFTAAIFGKILCKSWKELVSKVLFSFALPPVRD